MGSSAVKDGGERFAQAAGAGKEKARSASGKEPRPQVGALPYRHASDGALEVLLISSRDTGRWIIPKGWPIKGSSMSEAAATEAFEEAGLKGAVADEPIGTFDYIKSSSDGERWCRVTVYPLRVAKALNDWPEKSQRSLRWLKPAEAASIADDRGLATLILRLSEQIGDRAAS